MWPFKKKSVPQYECHSHLLDPAYHVNTEGDADGGEDTNYDMQTKIFKCPKGKTWAQVLTKMIKDGIVEQPESCHIFTVFPSKFKRGQVIELTVLYQLGSGV